MTEEEAKTKVCPFLSDGIFHTMGLNNVSSDYLARKDCIASDCMMWKTTDNECRPQNNENQKEICESAGHCGLTRG